MTATESPVSVLLQEPELKALVRSLSRIANNPDRYNLTDQCIKVWAEVILESRKYTEILQEKGFTQSDIEIAIFISTHKKHCKNQPPCDSIVLTQGHKMYNCTFCGTTTQPGLACHKVVTKRATIMHPYRPKAHKRIVIKNGKKKTEYVPDSGGLGTQIVVEQAACADCAAKYEAAEAKKLQGALK